MTKEEEKKKQEVFKACLPHLEAISEIISEYFGDIPDVQKMINCSKTVYGSTIIGVVCTDDGHFRTIFDVTKTSNGMIRVEDRY